MGKECFSTWSERFKEANIFDKQTLWSYRHSINIDKAVKSLLSGRPLEYIISKTHFGPDELFITEPLLIPRQDTYDWLENFCQEIFKQKKINTILELGVGTGAILYTLSKHYPEAELTGIDLSKKALETTAKNLSLLNKTAFLLSSHWFENLDSSFCFDLIISNPPYCAEEEIFWTKGLENEDQKALFSSFGGLNDLHKIIKKSKQYLNIHGLLALEHGAGQGPSVMILGKYYGFKHWKKLFDKKGFWRATCLW